MDAPHLVSLPKLIPQRILVKLKTNYYPSAYHIASQLHPRVLGRVEDVELLLWKHTWIKSTIIIVMILICRDSKVWKPKLASMIPESRPK